jgi:hypothetical protein
MKWMRGVDKSEMRMQRSTQFPLQNRKENGDLGKVGVEVGFEDVQWVNLVQGMDQRRLTSFLVP